MHTSEDQCYCFKLCSAAIPWRKQEGPQSAIWISWMRFPQELETIASNFNSSLTEIGTQKGKHYNNNDSNLVYILGKEFFLIFEHLIEPRQYWQFVAKTSTHYTSTRNTQHLVFVRCNPIETPPKKNFVIWLDWKKKQMTEMLLILKKGLNDRQNFKIISSIF